MLYSFDGGERFEPDYVMILRKNNSKGYEQYQIFVEPKGKHLLLTDDWKDKFLRQIEAQGRPTTTFSDDNEYRVIGLPFYNHDTADRMRSFSEAFEQVVAKI